jgi:tetratricopeptide (TPR) repeat protein
MSAMERDIIQDAIESGDPSAASEAIHEIDSRVQQLTNGEEKVGLLLNKAVFLGILKRFEEAREALVTALQQIPDGAETRLHADYIDGCLYHQEAKTAEAFTHLTAVLSKYAPRWTAPQYKFIYEDIQQQRAFELFTLRRFKDAIPIFIECLSFEMKPVDRSCALASLGICYSQLKNRQAAKNYLLQACEAGLTDDWAIEVHFHLGLTYAHLKLLEDSKREFLLCERLFPSAKVYGWLSRICELLGENAESAHYTKLAKPN